MATLNPTVQSVHIVDAGSVDGLREAEIYWTVAGTYDSGASAPIELLTVNTVIENATKDGKTVTVVDVMRGQRATNASTGAFMSTKAVTLSSTTVEMDITDADETTEIADATLPTQGRPFGTKIKYTVA